MDVCVVIGDYLSGFVRRDGWTKRFQFVVGIVHTVSNEYCTAVHVCWKC
jgi:hypothetical protein